MSGFDFQGAQIDIFNQRFKDSVHQQYPSGEFQLDMNAAVTATKGELNNDLA